jgi:protein-tyrosine phosphatase
LILNLVDVDNIDYIPTEIIDAALAAIHENISSSKVLVHCNQGMSRSPAIALLYMAKFTGRFTSMDSEAASREFCRIYPAYAPAGGMAEYVRLNWEQYAQVS